MRKKLKMQNIVIKSIQGLGVDISSVYRFKGLENDVVIFLVPDENTLKATTLEIIKPYLRWHDKSNFNIYF